MAHNLANWPRGRPLNRIVRHQPMSDILGLVTWGVIGGLIAGITLHSASPVTRRASVVGWCLTVGAIAAIFFGVAVAVGASIVPTRAVLGLGIVGFPALVAGVVMLALGRLKKSVPRPVGESADV